MAEFTFATVETLLAPLAVPVRPGPDIDELPAVLITVTVQSGAGLTNQGLFDRPSVQIRARGEPFDYAGAERLALDVDKRLLFLTDYPADVDGAYVLSITRTGGRPAPLGRDNGDRWEFTCTYLFGVATETA